MVPDWFDGVTDVLCFAEKLLLVWVVVVVFCFRGILLRSKKVGDIYNDDAELCV